MAIRTNNIFTGSAPGTASSAEKKKTSYWLEKLFNQNKKAIDESNELSQKNTDEIVNQVAESQEMIKTPEEKGVEEAAKSRTIKAEKNRQAVEDMVSNSNRIILKVMSVFPWEIFPTSIVVEEKRMTITRRQLFSSQVHSIDIKNISNVFINTGILFAQLKIISATFAENEIVVNILWKEEAILLRRIIEGLRLFISKDIDTTGYEVEELISKLKELSTRKTVL